MNTQKHILLDENVYVHIHMYIETCSHTHEFFATSLQFLEEQLKKERRIKSKSISNTAIVVTITTTLKFFTEE